MNFCLILRQQCRRCKEKSQEFVRYAITFLNSSIIYFQQRLNNNGRLNGKVRQELDLIRTVSIDEDLVWLRESILDLLQGEADWENEIEIALEQCGVNVKLSEKGKIHSSSVSVILEI